MHSWDRPEWLGRARINRPKGETLGDPYDDAERQLEHQVTDGINNIGGVDMEVGSARSSDEVE
jgi:hypothetical protein